jgi:arabinosyltransferase
MNDQLRQSSSSSSSSSSGSNNPRGRRFRNILILLMILTLTSVLVFTIGSSSKRTTTTTNNPIKKSSLFRLLGGGNKQKKGSNTNYEWHELKDSDDDDNTNNSFKTNKFYDYASKGSLKSRLLIAKEHKLRREEEEDLLIDLMGQKETRDAVLLAMNTNMDKAWKARDEKRKKGDSPSGEWANKPYEKCKGENCPTYHDEDNNGAKKEDELSKIEKEEEEEEEKEMTPEEEIIKELEDVVEEKKKIDDDVVNNAKEIISEAAKSSIALVDEMMNVETNDTDDKNNIINNLVSSSSSTKTKTKTKRNNNNKKGVQDEEEVEWSKFTKKEDPRKKEPPVPPTIVVAPRRSEEETIITRRAETVPEKDAKAGIFHEEQVPIVIPSTSSSSGKDDDENDNDDHHANMPENEYIKPISKRPEDNQLTEALAKRYSHENIVMVTWANNHYHDFVKNWVKHIRDCGMNNFLVGAMDNELLVKLIDDEVPTFAMQSGLTTADFGWGSKNFHQMGRKKIELIHLFTKMGFDILVSDVDTAWMKNPLPFIRKFPDVDVLTSSDSLSNFAKNEWSLESTTTGMANIGIMLLRKSAGALAKEWVSVLEKDDNIWDQNAFNDLMRKQRGRQFEDHSFEGYGGLKFGILPVSTFASGHTFFVQRMHERTNREPYVVHATFQFSGTEGKRHRLREFQLWYDDQEYYNPANGMLKIDLDVPDDLLKNAKETPEDHFALVNHQLLQVRAALMLANSLKRTLILPEFWCGMDRWWAPHRGIIPGSQLQLPYKCPADHIFELETWVRKNEPFREYSILDNPRTPDSVKNDVYDARGKLDSLSPEEFTDKKVLLALEPYTKHKVLRFDGKKLARKFALLKLNFFTDANARREFENKIINYCSIWWYVLFFFYFLFILLSLYTETDISFPALLSLSLSLSHLRRCC